jgi:DNA-binding GntR family transcriptional regulator
MAETKQNGGSQGGAGKRLDGELSLDKVHDLVRQAILHGEIEPGAIMSQVQMAQELGVSRTPLREALRLLQREGLVEAEPNRRVRVASFSIADLEQLYTLRIVNEALGIRLTVPQMSADDVEALRDLLSEMDRFAEARDPDRWEVPHREFHRRLVQGAGARPLRLLEELSDHSERYRRAYLDSGPRAWTTGPTEHAGILDACARGDEVEAAALLGRHLSRTALTVLMQIAPEHDPRDIRVAVRSVMRADESDPSPLGS